MPENIGTLHDVIADHWKQETPVYHYLLLISACFVFRCFVFVVFFFYIPVEDVLLKRYCLRSTVIPQARKTKPSIYEHVSMYTSLSIFFIYKKEKNATKKKVLEITGGLSSGSLLFHAFRYFTEVLLFNTILQFFFCATKLCDEWLLLFLAQV